MVLTRVVKTQAPVQVARFAMAGAAEVKTAQAKVVKIEREEKENMIL